MKKFINQHKLGFIMIVPGAIAGYFYWKYVGCNSGTCAIKSVWYNMVFFGGIMGYLVGDMIGDFIHKKKNKDKDENGSV